MSDQTPSERLARAEEVVREQRDEGIGEPFFDAYGDRSVCDADDFRDLRYELERLQRAVLGEPDPHG